MSYDDLSVIEPDALMEMGELNEEQATAIVEQADAKAKEAEQAAALERRRQREQDRIDAATAAAEAAEAAERQARELEESTDAPMHDGEHGWRRTSRPMASAGGKRRLSRPGRRRRR